MPLQEGSPRPEVPKQLDYNTLDVFLSLVFVSFKCVQAIDLCQAGLHLHVFQLSTDGPAMEELEDEDMAAASHWLLPAGNETKLN